MPSVSSPIVIGRRRELAELSAALRHSAHGRLAVILVAGEAGVGKTRLVTEAARLLPPDTRVLTGRCLDIAIGTVPFAPIVEVIRTMAGTLPPDELDRLVGSGRADLARLLPSLGDPRNEAEAGVGPDGAQGRLFEAVLALLEHASATRPTVLVIEDLHWADRSTLDLLTFLVRGLEHAAVGIVLTIRTDELHPRHPLMPFLSERNRGRPLVRIDLTPFDRAETLAQVTAILGHQPPDELVDLVHGRSEGNAFFAEELLAAGSVRGEVPTTLREVLGARVGVLRPPTRELLRIAAAAGTRIRTTTLEAVAGVDARVLLGRLREAVDHQILLPHDDPTVDGYRFRHALVQEVLYADLLPGERTHLHARLAAVLEAAPDVDRDLSIAAEVAHHWRAAREPDRALAASFRAGSVAESSWAFAEAQVQYEHALALWDAVADPSAIVGMDRVGLLERAAAAAAASAGAPAVAHIRQAIALVDPDADPERASLLHSRLSQYAWLSGNGLEALRAAREAARLIPSDPPTPARARGLAALGQILMVEGFMAESRPICEVAIAAARAVGARDVESHALTSLGVDLGYLGDLQGGLARLRQAEEIAREVGSVSDVSRALGNTVDLLNISGLYEDAARFAVTSFEYDDSHGLGSAFGVLTIGEGALALYRLGRWRDADELLARLRGHRPSGTGEIFVTTRLAALEIGRGRFDAARSRLDLLAGLLTHAVDPQWIAPFAELAAELALLEGRPRDAQQAVEDGLTAVARLSAIVPGQVGRLGPLHWLALRAAADEARVTRSRRAEHDDRPLLEFGRRHLESVRGMHAEIHENLPSLVPLADAYLAVAEAEIGRLEGTDDANRWAVAASKWAGLSMGPARAYCLWRQAVAILGQRGSRASAAALLREAHEFAAETGAEPFRRQVERSAGRARIAIEPPTAGQDAAGGVAATRLTSREREVLELIAAGRTNRQVADTLFISEKTAGAHVSNILMKLNAQGRTEAVAIGRSKGILAGTPPGSDGGRRSPD